MWRMNGCRRDGFGPDRQGEVAIYEQGRFFAVTGHTLAHPPADVANRQSELDRLCASLWPNTGVTMASSAGDAEECLQAIRAMQITDHNDCSN